MKILKHEDYEYRQLTSAGEEFSRSAILSSALGSKDFFIHYEILPPGRRASSPHFHVQTDEFLYVLKGHLVAIEAHHELELSTGDCAIFSANSQQLHFLENRSREDVELLVVSKKLPEPDVQFSAPAT